MQRRSGHDAIRVAVADVLAHGIRAQPVDLLPQADSPRWQGRILHLTDEQ
jgi:hypothetical protein